MQHPKQSFSLILLVPTRGSAESAEQQKPILHCTPHPARKELLWWQKRLSQWNGKALVHQSVDKVRYISAGMGSSLQWLQDRGTLTPGGAGVAHELSGVTCSSSARIRLEYQYCYSLTIRQQ